MKLQKLQYCIAIKTPEGVFRKADSISIQTGVCVIKDFGLYDIGTIIKDDDTIETRPIWQYWLHWGVGALLDTEIESVHF